MSEQPTLSRAEASSFLGVSIRTIDRLGLPKVKIARRTVYLRSDLFTYLEANRIQPIATPTVEPSREVIKAAVTGIAAKIKNKNTGEDPEARYRRRMAMLQAA
ncbi:helix-turn-helix domain-containing protein [Dongia deserti]|uniref:helix-turn-helix domain-containing protein n=1 Tax=Dongia deserti TaxID=2268030 RepID=UPI0013C47E66|nr:helix-turn-helix domain-containing protein [Dongia deserti]